MNRHRFVEEARNLVGTPYYHQGRSVILGLDCIGLCIVALQNAGWEPLDPESTLRSAYRAVPEQYLLREALLREADEIAPSEAIAGDILLFRWRSEDYPRHLATVVSTGPDGTYIVHTHRRLPKQCAVEQRMDAGLLNQVHSAYRIKGIED